MIIIVWSFHLGYKKVMLELILRSQKIDCPHFKNDGLLFKKKK